MIPSKLDPGWRNLLTGKVKHEFKCVPAGLMLSRACRDFAKEPARASELIDEVHNFFARYETILKDDLAAIFRK
jgi:hypothetical protein